MKTTETPLMHTSTLPIKGKPQESHRGVKSFKFLAQISLPADDAWKLSPRVMANTIQAVCQSYLRGVNCHEAAKVIVTIEEMPETCPVIAKGIIL